jgi:dolichol-phosphate mannosyltransferase
MKQLRQIAPTFGQFLLVGLSGTVVNLLVLWVLVEAGLPHFPAALAATEISILNNFFWNDCWTFRGTACHGSLLSRLGRFQLVTSFTAALTLGLFWLLYNNLQLHYLLAQFIAIGLATVLNFVINSRVTWSTPAKLSMAGTGKEIEEC